MKRLLASLLDLIFISFLSIACWMWINEASGDFFYNIYLFDERSVLGTLKYIAEFIIACSFFYYLGVVISKGATFGKSLLSLQLSKTSLAQLIIREIIVKWFVFITVPLSFFVINQKIGSFVILFFLLIWLILNVLLIAIKKKGLSDILSRTLVENNEIPYSQRFLTLSWVVIQFSLLISITFLLDLLISKYIYLNVFHLFILLVLVYGIVLGFIRSTFSFLLFVFLPFIVLPYLLLWLIGGVDDPYQIMLGIIIFSSLFVGCYFSYFNCLPWHHWDKTVAYRNLLQPSYLVIAGILLIVNFIFIQQINNNIHKSSFKIVGFNFPFAFPEYPTTSELAVYTDFLQQPQQSPQDYLLSLFDKYDIVILGEMYHGESTQWDMIWDVVSSPKFIQKVGNVFTEYGSSIHQNKLNAYLVKEFENDTIRAKETATLMDFMSGGFYSFLKHTNHLNQDLPDDLKIKVFFSDMIDWDLIPDKDRWNITGLDQRDSIMAQVLINWYSKDKGSKKCLLITNSRHSFGYAGSMDKVKNSHAPDRLKKGNHAQYIAEAFPDVTANVVQVGSKASKTFILPLHSPNHNGKWAKAFLLNDNKPVGFDLKNSPFGNDWFDMNWAKGAKMELTYADIYTGLIFNKPLNQMQEYYHPYHKYALEQECKRKNITDSIYMQQIVQRHIDDDYLNTNMTWAKTLFISNALAIILLCLTTGVGFAITVYHLIRKCISFKSNLKAI